MLEHVDWYLCGGRRGRARSACAAGAAAWRSGRARRGRPGALASVGGEPCEVTPARAEEVVDEIGAGDAFAAGFVYGLLQGWDPERCTHAAHVIAGWALRGTGDWETLPRLDDVRHLLP